MHELKDFLQNLTMVLGVAAVISLVFHKLRQPVVLGYILAGLIIGPHIPIPLVADSEIVHTLSELGVILLMFSLGLEFSIRKFLKVLPTAGLVALIQCGFMIWLGYVVGRAFGWTILEAVYAGAIIAISSTTIIVKAFSDEGIKDKLTEIVFAILIVEDLVAVLLLAGLPALSQEPDASGWLIAKTASTLFIFLISLLIVGILVIPRVLRIVMSMNRPEMTLVVSIGICFAISLLAKEMGYSVALGAFMAGSMMAEAGEEGYLNNLIRPIRDLFAAIFFVSVGMLIDPSLIAKYWFPILVFTLLVIGGKLLGVTSGAFLSGYSMRMSIRSGMSLAQIGEFSFIIAGVGLVSGATREFMYPLAVAVSAITTLTTPWFIRRSDTAAKWVDRHLPESLQTFVTVYGTWIQKLRGSLKPVSQRSYVRRLFRLLLIDTILFAAILIGASLSRDALSARLKSWLNIPEEWANGIGIAGAVILLIPFCIGIIRCARSLGLTLATEVLPSQEDGTVDLAAAPRRALVVTLQLAIVLLVGLPLLALTQPFLRSYYGAALLAAILAGLGIAFWRSATELHGHVQAGAGMIIEALNASIDKQREIPVMQMEQLLPGLGPIFSIRLTPESHAVGFSLAELNLRALTGANVIAINRGTEGFVVPIGKEQLKTGDVLTITGTEEAIQAAKQFLLPSA